MKLYKEEEINKQKIKQTRVLLDNLVGFRHFPYHRGKIMKLYNEEASKKRKSK